jgi:hypothetical protein
MVQTYLNNVRDVPLFVIAEGPIKLSALPETDGSLTLVTESARAIEFRRRFSKLNEANGFKIIRRGADSPPELIKNYRWDAVRFSHKVFAVELASTLPQCLDADVLFWIDADVITRRPLTSQDLCIFAPGGDVLMSYLGRTHKYSECGFMGFNLKLSSTVEYISTVASLYSTGEIFSLDEYHDSYVWDHVRLSFEAAGKNFLNLSGPVSHTSHPFVNTGLGLYFDHLKGEERKKRGRSFDEDYVN